MPKKILKTTGFLAISLLLCVRSIAGSTPPVTTLTKDPSSPDGNNDWYVSPVTYTLDATDLESGVKEINYRIDGGIWQKESFGDTLNLAPNPSFENTDVNPPLTTASWQPNLTDGDTSYSRDIINYMSGFDTTSIKIESAGSVWHAINHIDNFAASTPYNNMNASVWVKTDGANSAYFKIYAVEEDEFGVKTYTEIAQSGAVSGTSDWTQLSSNFIVSVDDAIGVYMEVGLLGIGSVWIDAVNISNNTTASSTSFAIASDGNHTVDYYSVDRANNVEATKNDAIKIDQTAPGNWTDSGAIRGLLGAEHEVYVYTNVSDATSGLSTLTDKFQYTTSKSEGFGVFEDLLGCNTEWLLDEWVSLISPPFDPGTNDAYLLTPKVDFCDSNWKVCKYVRFYAEDMAGNYNAKDMCINGPWIRTTGEGIVRSNNDIDMISEAYGDNSDGMIELQRSTINFFSTSSDLVTVDTPAPPDYDYSKFFELAPGGKTEITGGSLQPVSGTYISNGDYEIRTNTTPSGYKTATFDQVVFIDGNLTISSNITTDASAAALFIVSGDVKIAKQVTEVAIAIIADGDLYTAYDISEGDSAQTLTLSGFFVADEIVLRRTLQGTQNDKDPAEDFIFEPKYIIKLRDYVGVNTVKWLSSE
ncbi:hypothetical protein ACFLZ4_01495 [Patescibacteria group bacterium]